MPKKDLKPASKKARRGSFFDKINSKGGIISKFSGVLFFIGMDIPQKGILYTPVRPAKSTPKNAQNSQKLSKRGQNRPNFCIFVAKKIAKTLLYGFVKIYTWICKILYLVKVV